MTAFTNTTQRDIFICMNASIMILYLYFLHKNVQDYNRSSKIKQNFYETLCRMFHSPSVIKNDGTDLQTRKEKINSKDLHLS